jgi:uncharacterized protein YcbX
MEKVGDLAAIWRYPVKSLRGESLASAQVEQDGLPGDRASALVVRDGHARIGKTLRGKEHERLHLMDSAAEGVASSAERGITVDVRSDDAHYFDDSPISIIVDRWLEGLSANVGYAVEYSRFRPNFFVRADPDFRAVETDLIGRELLVGEVRLRVRYGDERCVVVTYDPKGGSDDPRVLRYIAQERNNVMGVYCEVLHPGRVQAGDTLYLL